MPTRRLALLAGSAGVALAGAGCSSARLTADSRSQLLTQLRAAEEGFAATMARRDLVAFAEFIADDAVFINGGKPLRGKAEIVEHWKRFFIPAAAPFSWRPELVELASQGSLGYTEGPVLSETGLAYARFFSTWQVSSSGRWLVVFDNGYPLCKA